jgi:hypothetical protein
LRESFQIPAIHASRRWHIRRSQARRRGLRPRRAGTSPVPRQHLAWFQHVGDPQHFLTDAYYELHWYEAHGIGKKEFKRKQYLD